MNNEQLVRALINSYKMRGVDLSFLLDDPLFTKLPPEVKIQAIQEHAEELHGGVDPSLAKAEIYKILLNAGMSGFIGAGAGAGIAKQIANAGFISDHGMAVGAILGGLGGAVAGGLGSLSSVDDRRDLKSALDVARQNPSPETAIGVLSTKANSAPTRLLRDKLLDQVGAMIMGASNAKTEEVLKQHARPGPAIMAQMHQQ